MFIKKIRLDEKEFEFDKSKKIVFIKENEDNSGAFLKAMKDIFCTRNIWLDCVSAKECDLYCECEKSGTDFFITVKMKARSLFDQENTAGLCGNFEVSCKYQSNTPLTDEQRTSIRLIKVAFQEFLLSEVTAEIAFYQYSETYDLDYTPTVIYDNYIKICKAEDVVKDFINNFGYIYFDNYRLGFNKRTQEFELTEEEIISDMNQDGVAKTSVDDMTDKQWNIVALWDYITANKLNEKLQDFYRFDGKTPLFIENAFENMTDEEIGMFMKEIAALERQTFIIEKQDNAFHESFCDRKVIFETNLEENVIL